jgi:hypothetical protein
MERNFENGASRFLKATSLGHEEEEMMLINKQINKRNKS